MLLDGLSVPFSNCLPIISAVIPINRSTTGSLNFSRYSFNLDSISYCMKLRAFNLDYASIRN